MISVVRRHSEYTVRHLFTQEDLCVFLDTLQHQRCQLLWDQVFDSTFVAHLHMRAPAELVDDFVWQFLNVHLHRRVLEGFAEQATHIVD